MSTQTVGTGAWTEYARPNAQEEVIFNATFNNKLGVHNRCLAAKHQVVAGVNYQFIYLSSPVVPNAKVSLHIADVFVAPGQIAGEVKKDVTISSDLYNDEDKKGLLGGWSKFAPLSPQDEAQFQIAMKKTLGVKYKATEMSHRLVGRYGAFHLYKAVGTIVVPSQPTFDAYILTYTPAGKEPILLYIQRA